MWPAPVGAAAVEGNSATGVVLPGAAVKVLQGAEVGSPTVKALSLVVMAMVGLTVSTVMVTVLLAVLPAVGVNVAV